MAVGHDCQRDALRAAGGNLETTLEQAIVVAFFLPMVLGLNESVAMQAMSLSLQSLHGNRKVRWDSRKLRRELMTSLLLSGAASVIVGLIAAAWRKHLPSALVLTGSLLVSLVVAAAVGFSIPILLRLGERDPKLAAGPIALAVVDVMALLFYFTTAMVVLT